MEPKKTFRLKDRIKSFGYAFNGLKILFRNEHNAWIHAVAMILVIVFGIYFEVSSADWGILILCIAMVLAAEIFNTAIEYLCNYVSPEKQELIGKVKDLAAASVLVTAMGAAFVGLLVFWKYF